MAAKLTEENKQLLYSAILHLKSPEECDLCFSDLCTEKEIGAMVQRLSVAKMLQEERNYADIVEATGASTATVSRVKRSSENYRIVLDRMKEDA